MPKTELCIGDMHLRVSDIDAKDAPHFARAVYEQLALRFSQVTSKARLGALHLRLPAQPNADAARLAASVAEGIVRELSNAQDHAT